MSVTVENVQRYLKARGWAFRKEALRDRGLYWYDNPNATPRQLTFPIDQSASDYEPAFNLALAKLAESERKTLQELQTAISEAGDDTLRFRLFGSRVDSTCIPFTFLMEALTGAKELLLASAHSALEPRRYFPRMGRREPLSFLNSTGFGQTEPGSFVFKLTCPVAENFSLFPQAETPLARRATLSVNSVLHALSEGIKYDALDELVVKEQKGDTAALSSNLCQALVRMYDEKLENSLDISFSWAVTLPAPDYVGKANWVRFEKEDFKRIGEVGDALRATERVGENLFVGTVEELNGQMGTDGRRFGDVIFRVFVPGEEMSARARATLSPEDYASADKAHMTEGSYCLFVAKLQPGRQPRALTDVDNFEWYFKEDEEIELPSS